MAKVVILSGAGISAESGIDTFRKSDGLWEKYSVKDICSVGCLETNRDMTLEFYDQRRMELEDKLPNKVHTALVNLKKKYKDSLAIFTQNVDNLFEKAGMPAEDIVHLHGYMTNVACENCHLVYDIGYKAIGSDRFDGKCPTCGSKKIRPWVVMFGETAPYYKKLDQEMSDCEFFIVLGTSGNVIDVNIFAQLVSKSLLNNLEPSDAIREELFSKVLYKNATDVIDEIAEQICTHLDPYVYSLQVGKVQQLDNWETGSFKNSVKKIEVLYDGVKEDEIADIKNHGGIEKAVFANSLENYPQWKEFLDVDTLQTGGLSENITLSGLDETNVYLGDIHTIGDVMLQVVQPRKPCWKISKKHNNKAFTKHIYETGRTGWYYSVLQKGTIVQNSKIEITHTEEIQISIIDANKAFRECLEYKNILEDILTLKNISTRYKQSILKRLVGEYSLAFMENKD